MIYVYIEICFNYEHSNVHLMENIQIISAVYHTVFYFIFKYIRENKKYSLIIGVI